MAADALDLPLTPPAGGEVLYRSDRCTLIWGDCRDRAVIAQVPNWYGLLATDPPYGVNWESNSRIESFGSLAGDDGTVDWPAVLAEWVGPDGTWTQGLANSRHVYVFGYTPKELVGPLRLGATAELVWDKESMGMGDLAQPWGPSHERFTFGVHKKGPTPRASGGGALSARLRQGTVLRVQRPVGRGVTRHPTEKPWLLMAQLIESSTVHGDLVVDPCAGSGSTLIAAILEGRRGFGVEIDRRYAELAVGRIRAAEKIADQIAGC